MPAIRPRSQTLVGTLWLASSTAAHDAVDRQGAELAIHLEGVDKVASAIHSPGRRRGSTWPGVLAARRHCSGTLQISRYSIQVLGAGILEVDLHEIGQGLEKLAAGLAPSRSAGRSFLRALWKSVTAGWTWPSASSHLPRLNRLSLGRVGADLLVGQVELHASAHERPRWTWATATAPRRRKRPGCRRSSVEVSAWLRDLTARRSRSKATISLISLSCRGTIS